MGKRVGHKRDLFNSVYYTKIESSKSSQCPKVSVKSSFSRPSVFWGAKQIGQATVTAHWRPRWLSLASTSKTIKSGCQDHFTLSHFLFLFLFSNPSTDTDRKQNVAVSEETCAVYSRLSHTFNITSTKATHIYTTTGSCYLWERPEFTQKKKKNSAIVAESSWKWSLYSVVL